jgi:hypothetical protein
VASLYLQDGPFWEAVREMRVKWNVQPQTMVPSGDDAYTNMPLDQLYQPKKILRALHSGWDADLRSLISRFVPDLLVRVGWHNFFGACVMCDPPDDRLPEFAEFDRLWPSPFWPVVDCEDDEIDASKVHSMIAPPIERVLKESYEPGGVFMEYRIVVDEDTKEKDVVNAFRAIKAACDISNPGGRPRLDRLIALQCAVLYDDYNSTDPEDRRRRVWTYKKLADKFRQLGVKNARSAEEHVKYGRDLRKDFRNP